VGVAASVLAAKAAFQTDQSNREESSKAACLEALLQKREFYVACELSLIRLVVAANASSLVLKLLVKSSEIIFPHDWHINLGPRRTKMDELQQ